MALDYHHPDKPRFSELWVARQQQRRQGWQQRPGQGQHGGNNSNSSKIGGNTVTTAVSTIARETRDEGNVATTTGYCGNGGGKVDSDSGGKSKGSTATTAGYCGNGIGGNKDVSKGNSGKNGENGGNNRGGASLMRPCSHLSLFLFLWSGSGHGHKVRFFAR